MISPEIPHLAASAAAAAFADRDLLRFGSASASVSVSAPDSAAPYSAAPVSTISCTTHRLVHEIPIQILLVGSGRAGKTS